jgi:hypothetical protein
MEQLDTNFELIDDFTNNKSIFRPDTFKLNDQSTDGGELIAFHTKDRDYLVIDAWLYGETGKLHVTFWTDMKINLKFAQRTNYEYDRPYYEPGYKTQETIEYYSFFDKGFRFYNSDKKEIKELGDKKKIEIEKLFADLTKDVEIVK